MQIFKTPRYKIKYIDSNFINFKSNETFIENLINLFSLMPGLIKEDESSETTSLFV